MRTRFVSLFLVLAMLTNFFAFSSFAQETGFDGSDAAVGTVSTDDENSSEEATEVTQGDESNAVDSPDDGSEADDTDSDGISDANADGGIGGENTANADDESVSSYTVNITLPEEGVKTAEDSGELTQTVSAGSGVADIRLVSTYEDEPFESDMADAFNARLFEGTGLTASFGGDGVITISGTPNADVSVDLTDAFAEDEPVTIEDSTAVYVSSEGNDSTGDGTEGKPYATISKAYSAVADKGTIYLLSDIEITWTFKKDNSVINFNESKSVTITSCGDGVKTIKSKCTISVKSALFSVTNGANVTFKNIVLDGSQQTSYDKNESYHVAVYVTNGTLTLESGTIIQNFNYGSNSNTSGGFGGWGVVSAQNGGARVNICTGAKITNCKIEGGWSDNPAGVVVAGLGAIVNMTGGEIVGNTLQSDKDSTTAVVSIGKISSPHFWMTGGTITNNTIGGGYAAVYMRGEADACDMQFGNTAYVYGNYISGTSGDQRNIYLKNDANGDENDKVYAKLCSALTGDAKLGIYAEHIGMGTKVAQGTNESGTATTSTPTNSTYTATVADTTYFVSDKATDAEILYCGGSEDTCGLLAHRDEDTDHNSEKQAIYLSVSPEVTAKKGENDTITLDIARCTRDATYVVLDEDMKPVTGKTFTNGSYDTDGKGTFTLNADASTTTISMPGLDKDSGPYTVMQVGDGGLTVNDDGTAETNNLTDIATVNIVNFTGDGVTWDDGTNSFENGDFDIVTVPHNDQTGKANKTYTATTKARYTFATSDAITAKLDNSEAAAVTVNTTKETDTKYNVTVTVPAYGTTEKGTKDYSTVTLTGTAVKVAATAISVTVEKVTANNEDEVGTLNESLTATLDIKDSNTYGEEKNPTYKYTVTNGRTKANGDAITGNVTKPTTGGDDEDTTAYSITGLKYGDHVKVYVDGEDDIPATYFKVLNNCLENGSFEQIKSLSGDSCHKRKTGVDIAAWRTTANDQNMEVYPNPTTTYSVDKVPDGSYVAELNATEASSLYQEINTTPGNTLSWTLEHTARGNGGRDDQRMAIVIGPTQAATNTDPYKKSSATTNDMFMNIAAQITSPVVGETYYTTYNNQAYQVTIASDTKSGRSWKNYMGTYTVPAGQTETVFAFASLDTDDDNAKLGNMIDDVGFGAGVAITEVKAAKNSGETNKIDISIENSTKNGVYVVLDKDMKPVTGATLGGGEYVNNGNGTFKLKDSDSSTTVSMAALAKDKGPYTVMRVLSGTLSVDSENKASTTNLTDIATVNIVQFMGDGVTWSSAKTTTFASGDYDIVTVPHDDQTGKAKKTYTVNVKAGFAFVKYDSVSSNGPVTADGSLTTATVKDNTDGSKEIAIEVPAYDTTSKGTTGYVNVTLVGHTVLNSGVKLLDKTGGSEMTETGNVVSKTYDSIAVAYQDGSVAGAELSYTWQKVTGSEGGKATYTDLTAAPSDAGEYNLKVTATSTNAPGTELGTENLPFTISKKELTVTATAEDKTYDGGTTATLKNAKLDGVLDADKNYVELNKDKITVAFNNKKAGDSKTVTATVATDALTGNKAGNYTITTATAVNAKIIPKPITATITATNKTYDGNTNATVSTPTLLGVIENDKVNATASSAVFDSASVAKNKIVTASITLQGDDANNYKLESSTATAAADITAKQLNVTVTAENKPYDGNTDATASVTLNTTDIVNDEISTVSLDSAAMKAAFDTKEVGDGKTVTVTGLSLTGTSASNYKLPDTITGTASITQSNGGEGTVTLDGWTYGDTAKTPNANSTTNPETNTDKITYQYKVKDADDNTYTDNVPKDAGEYTVKANFPANVNYTATTATANFTIAKKPLTATIEANNKEYDGTNAATVEKVDLTGVMNGDSITATASGVQFDNANAGTGKTVTATITLNNPTGAAKNYTVASTATTTANITAKTLTVTAKASDKVYNGTTEATITVVTMSGVVGSDTVSLNQSNMTAAFASANVGENMEITISGLTLNNNVNNNYKLPETITTTANITQAGGSGEVKLEGWTYGDTANAPNASSTTDPETDTDKITYQYKVKDADDNTYADTVPTNAGTYTVKATFPATQNYTEATATKDFTISPKTLTVTVTVANKTYDGTNTARVTDVKLSGAVEDDNVSLNKDGMTAAFGDANVGTGKTVTVYGLALIGASAKNYQLPSPITTTANITSAYQGGAIVIPDSVSDDTQDDSTDADDTEDSDNDVLDSTAPVIKGAIDGKTYCAAITLTITDKNLDTVKLNGKKVTLTNGKLRLEPAKGKQTVTAKDKAGNRTSITVTVNNGCTWSAWTPVGDGIHHERTCRFNAAHTETGKCTGGKATASARAVCDICGGKYGKLAPADHVSLEHVAATSATTEAEGNIEYWYDADKEIYYKNAAATMEITKEETVTPKLGVNGTIATTPKTGDESDIALWFVLLIVSGVGISATTVLGIRKKHSK